MKTSFSAIALSMALAISGVAVAQVPSGGAGSDAKGNAPLKHAHTVNDGAARRGHNSFTEGQARTHILKAGYQSVTGLTKGEDGVWRGTAMKNGAGVAVGMDFKGNVSEDMARTSQAMSMSTTGAAAPAMATDATTTTTTATTTAATTGAADTAHHHHRRAHHAANRCANPTPNGAACSGVDRNANGVSDKEDRAMKAGAHP